MVQFFSQPAVVLGVVAFVGLLAQKKGAQKIIDGTAKTILGYLIMQLGINAINGALGPINSMFRQAYKLEGFFRLDETVVAAVAPTLGTQTALILALGFLLSVILARITPFKYIYLTGHHLWVHAGEIAILMWSLGLSGPAMLIAGTIMMGFYLILSPAVFQPLMRQLTGGDEIALAHGNMTKYWISIKFALLFGKDKVDAENMPLPKGLDFFRDMALSMAIIMLIVTIPAALVAGPTWVQAELSKGQNFLLYAFLLAMTFTAGVLVLLQGVRMLIAELVPAFRGISQKIVPGAIPALDCPVIIPYGPTSVIIGTVVGTIAQFIAIFILAAIGWPIPIPSMIGSFFGAGHAAAVANKLAGRRAALIAAFTEGIFNYFLGSFAYKVLLFGNLEVIGAKALYPSSSDAHVLAALVRLVGAVFGLGR